MTQRKGKIIIPPGRKPWPHELRVAEILAGAGHTVEFISEHITHRADICLDGIEYEIKSPELFNANTLEHTLKRATKQSLSIIISTIRTKKAKDIKIEKFLIGQMRKQKQIKCILMINKKEQIIDISKLI